MRPPLATHRLIGNDLAKAGIIGRCTTAITPDPLRSDVV